MTYKNAAIIFIIFIIFSLAVCFVPQISEFDITAIKCTQNFLSVINNEIPVAAGGICFYIMTFIPLLAICPYFFIKKMYKNMFLFAAIPFISYFINSIVKWIVQRPRPPIELQFEEHMTSSSYVSRHTFVTACLWGLFIYFVCKYCKNNYLKYFLTGISLIWILFEGFSRIWMGVHNPTDVIGALILASVFIIIYINLIKRFNNQK